MHAADVARIVSGLLDYRTNDLVDGDGRALGEVSSPRYDPARTELVACPYADARRGQPMNLSALRQLAAPWPALPSTVRALAGPAPTVHRTWWVSLAGTVAPLLVDGPVPVGLSALYKTSLGLSQVTASLLLAEDGVADAPFAELGDDAAFFAFLDDGRWLVGQQQVCAGTAPQIREIARALAGGPPLGGPILAPLDTPSIAALVDLAAAVVGLQAACIGAVYAAVRRGADDGLSGTPAEAWLARTPPWLRAWAAVPNRPPDQVRRLYPTGGTPDVVERFLAGGPATAGVLAERFDVAIRALCAQPDRAAPGI
jgi:hypothetical protein